MCAEGKCQMKMASNCRYHHQLTAHCASPTSLLCCSVCRSLSISQSVIHSFISAQNASSAYLSTQTDGDVVIHAGSLRLSLSPSISPLQSLFRLHSRRHFWSALCAASVYVCVCIHLACVCVCELTNESKTNHKRA